MRIIFHPNPFRQSFANEIEALIVIEEEETPVDDPSTTTRAEISSGKEPSTLKEIIEQRAAIVKSVYSLMQQ